MRRPSHSTIAAYAALFIALGGSSYAAIKIPKNSVGAKQIKTNAVRSSDVKNGAVKAVDLAAGVVTSGPTGPAGSQGETGVAGPIGPTGPPGSPDTSNFFTKTESDGRFLGIAATAADAGKLDGIDSDEFVKGGGRISRQQRVVTGGASGVVPIIAADGTTLATATLNCSDPATTSTVTFALAAGISARFVVDDGSTVQAGPGPFSTASAAADRITANVASGFDSILVNLFTVAPFGGGNDCLVNGVSVA